MLGRFLIFMTMVLLGPLFIEVYLYHPPIALARDAVAIVPLVVSPLAIVGGFLLLAVDSRLTVALFALVCATAVVVGVIGTAIHAAMHAPTLLRLATDATVWLGEPPILVPLSFAAAGCLGLIAVAVPELRRLEQPPVAMARMLEAMAAVCGLVGAIAGAQVQGGAVALIAVIGALGFGSFGFAGEIAVLIHALWRGRPAYPRELPKVAPQ